MTRNITLSLPDDLVRRAKVIAAQRDTSVSALVADLLRQLTGPSPDFAEVWAQEVRLMQSGSDLSLGKVTWARGDLHER